jgi:hypothetical protein
MIMSDAALSRAVEEAIADAVVRLHHAYPGVSGEKLADRLAMRTMQMIGADAVDVRRLVQRTRYRRQFGMLASCVSGGRARLGCSRGRWRDALRGLDRGLSRRRFSFSGSKPWQIRLRFGSGQLIDLAADCADAMFEESALTTDTTSQIGRQLAGEAAVLAARAHNLD